MITKIALFMLFCSVEYFDFVFTGWGIELKFVEEKNFLITKTSQCLGVSVSCSILIFKLLAVLLAFFLLFFAPNFLEITSARKDISLEFLLKEKMTEYIVLLLTLATFVFWSLPTIAAYYHHIHNAP